MLTTRSYIFRLTQRLLENRCTHCLVFSHALAILPTGGHQTSWCWTLTRLNSLCSTLAIVLVPHWSLLQLAVTWYMLHMLQRTYIGVWFDEFLSMDKQVKAVCKSAFFHLRNIAKIRKYIPFTHCKILIHAFITSKLDYCNSLLSGLRQDHLTNFSLCKLLPHVFWPVLGNMNILGLFLGCLFRKELILNFYFLHLNHLMM